MDRCWGGGGVVGSLRRALHERLGLPLDRPRLRLAQAERWTPATSTAATGRAVRLRDVHLHAKPSDRTSCMPCLNRSRSYTD